eukprot:IDg7862t1
MTLSQRGVLPSDHGLTEYTSNAAKPLVRNAIGQYITDILAVDGHPLQIRVRRSDGKYVDDFDEAKATVVLPPRGTVRTVSDKNLVEKANE